MGRKPGPPRGNIASPGKINDFGGFGPGRLDFCARTSGQFVLGRGARAQNRARNFCAQKKPAFGAISSTTERLAGPMGGKTAGGPTFKALLGPRLEALGSAVCRGKGRLRVRIEKKKHLFIMNRDPGKTGKRERSAKKSKIRSEIPGPNTLEGGTMRAAFSKNLAFFHFSAWPQKAAGRARRSGDWVTIVFPGRDAGAGGGGGTRMASTIGAGRFAGPGLLFLAGRWDGHSGAGRRPPPILMRGPFVPGAGTRARRGAQGGDGPRVFSGAAQRRSKDGRE